MKYLIIYARAAAFKRFCKQSKSGSGGSRESCLTRVYSVCLRGYEVSNHTQVELVQYARTAAFKRFVNKVDPDQAALLRAA